VASLGVTWVFSHVSYINHMSGFVFVVIYYSIAM